VKQGDRLELRVEKPVYRGLGLARHEGRIVFVTGTYSGERVHALVEEVGRGYARARLLELIEPSPARRISPCRYAPRCGGCSYQDLDYQEQLAVKQAILRESLLRARVPWEAEIPVMPSPERGWRTRAELHLDWRDDGPLLGFHEVASHRVVDVLECLQLSPAMNGAARALLDALSGHGPLARRVTGLELAESMDGRKLVACLVSDLPVRQAVAFKPLASAVPALTGLLALAASGSAPRTALLLSGEPFLDASVRGFLLRAHQQSFFQANRFLLEPLVEAVLECVPAGRPVLDLYSGVGLFALALAARGDPVRGVESNRWAAADAEANARELGLAGIHFELADVDAALRELAQRPGERVVLDPPRTGASRLAVTQLAARRPASICYVSCDPPTLGRDVHLLADLGYRLASLRAFDMFPDTLHLESIALLEPV
jgi:23S rRNA (uracil1939-C5)-methyltransferase